MEMDSTDLHLPFTHCTQIDDGVTFWTAIHLSATNSAPWQVEVPRNYVSIGILHDWGVVYMQQSSSYRSPWLKGSWNSLLPMEKIQLLPVCSVSWVHKSFNLI